MVAPSQHARQLALLLQSRGISPARELAAALRVSQPTFSRAILELEASGALERVGAARKTRYALRRPLRQWGHTWPLIRINEAGRPHVWANMTALYGGYRVTFPGAAPAWMREYPDGLFPGLPFFLQDARPTGFLGRAIAREGAHRLGLPADLNRWQDDDALAYFLTEGDALAGDLIVGNAALERWYRNDERLESTAIDAARIESEYPRLAAAAQRGEAVGSSAGGEQPKFTATLRRGSEWRCVLVKFTADEPSPVQQRWADLLLSEHHAAEVLHAKGIACAQTRIFDASGRRFLEVERFDRRGRSGRRGVLTLGAIEDALVAESSRDWSVAAAAFERTGLCDSESTRRLRWIWCFGSLIGNTDMHRANAGFWFSDALPFTLAPTYDMLPMQFAPGAHGIIGERDFSPTPPLPAIADVWADAAAAAVSFWQTVTSDARMSDDFRRIASRCLETVHHRLTRYA